MGTILDVASDMLDSNIISISVFKPWQEETILNYADKRFRLTRADTLNYSIADYSVINFLKRFNDNPSNAMLKKWLQVEGNENHKQAIVLALLENMPARKSTGAESSGSQQIQPDWFVQEFEKIQEGGVVPDKIPDPILFCRKSRAGCSIRIQ